MANEAIRKEPLTKKERNNLFRRYMTFNAPGFDYVYYMGKSWPWWLKPFFKLFYNKEGYAENMSRHFDFYNCESGTAALLFGTILGLEERKALKGDVDEETIRSIKVGLQGPLAGIGDSLIQATLLPILMTITLALCAETGSIAGQPFFQQAGQGGFLGVGGEQRFSRGDVRPVLVQVHPAAGDRHPEFGIGAERPANGVAAGRAGPAGDGAGVDEEQVGLLRPGNLPVAGGGQGLANCLGFVLVGFAPESLELVP